MMTNPVASIPDEITTKLIEALSCLSNASDLLQDDATSASPEVAHWLAATSDDLMQVGLDIHPGEVRHQLLLMLAVIESRSSEANLLVTPHSIDRLHGEVGALLRAHTRFFEGEERVLAIS